MQYLFSVLYDRSDLATVLDRRRALPVLPDGPFIETKEHEVEVRPFR